MNFERPCLLSHDPPASPDVVPSHLCLYSPHIFDFIDATISSCGRVLIDLAVYSGSGTKKKKPIQMWSTVNDCLPLSHDSRLRFPVSRPECHLWALGGFVGISRTHAALHGFLLFICNCKRFFEGEKKETIVSALLSLAQLCSLFSALCQREWEPRLSTSL